MPRVLILSLALLAGACAHAEPIAPVVAPPDPCPASAAAELEPRIAEERVTDDEALSIGRAIISILGTDRFAKRELATAQGAARTRRLETRIVQTRDWCTSRQPRPG